MATLQKLPESIIMIGAGPIAREMAQAFTRLGSKATVLEIMDQILLKEDADLAGHVMKVMQEEGVTFYLKASLSR